MRIAVINSHPIQYFGPLWHEIAKTNRVVLKVFFCCEWGSRDYVDPGFGTLVRWDVDLRQGYDSEVLPLRKPVYRLGFWEINNLTVADALARFDPDLLVLFGYNHLTSWRALLWARRNGVRVLTFSDSQLKQRRKAWVRLLKQAVVRTFFSQLDGALPISNSNAAYYRHYGLGANRLHWCAQPIDGERFDAALAQKDAKRAAVRGKLKISSTDFVFATVGKYVAKKRPLEIAQAWLALDESLKRRSHLLLVGEGELRPQLEELAASPEADGRIKLTGFVNQRELPDFYLASDATVLASDTEPHGQVVTESLFLSVPAIVSDRVGCVGPEDVMRDGQTGLVYPCGDIKALSAAMNALMSDQAKHRYYAQRAREVAAGQDARVVAERFIQACETVLCSPSPTLLDRARTFVPFLKGHA